MRTVAALGEDGVIQRFRRIRTPSRGVRLGIGDDAAVLQWQPGPGQAGRGTYLLLASDMLVESVHFDRRAVPARWIGWKALACNVSDVAAMGGVPRFAVVSIGLPSRTPARFVEELAGGLASCARRYGVALVGGDTVRAPCVVVDVAIVGEVAARELVTRSGARTGDRLFVTGSLGGSSVGQRHARFIPRLREARWLVRHLPIHAMIDLSDGLACDLWHLARASRVTLRVHESAIPVSASARRLAASEPGPARARKALWHALMDGEDFELLFAVPDAACVRVPRALGRISIRPIGSVVGRGARVEVLGAGGRVRMVTPEGFRHFS